MSNSDQTLTDFDTSVQYQGLSIVFFGGIAYALGIQFVWTLMALWTATGKHSYGPGKRPEDEYTALHGDTDFWYRWLRVPDHWLPLWGWTLITFIVAGTFGAATGLFVWIVNDYAGYYWLTIVCFFFIIPILAGAWAVFLFYGHYLGVSLAFAILYCIASGVLVGMTCAYAVQYPQTGAAYLSYQWIAFGMGSLPQFLWSVYVMAVAINMYMHNSDRSMNDLAPGESKEERQTVIDHVHAARLKVHNNFAEIRHREWGKRMASARTSDYIRV